jgi:hypothetical protein
MTPHIEDRLLTIDEAAEVLRTTKDYLCRHHKAARQNNLFIPDLGASAIS